MSTETKRFKFTGKLIDQLPPHPQDSRSSEAEYTDTEVVGLKLLVSKSGRKFYYFRYTFDGKKRAVKLGEHGALPLPEARKKALAIRHQVNEGNDPQAVKVRPQAVMNLSTFALEEYLPYARQHKLSADGDESKLRLHILPQFGGRGLDAINTREVQLYHAGVRSSHCAATANRHLSLLSRMFKLAVQWGRIDRNPCLGVAKFRENNQRECFLSADEIQRMFLAMEAEGNKVAVAALKFLLLTGIRREEALQAKWEHIDLERGALFLPHTKSGKSRSVILNVSMSIFIDGLSGLFDQID